MPLQLVGSTFYDAITDDLIAAWDLEEGETIFYGALTQDTAGRPYAIVSLGSVPMEWAGVRCVEQTYEFQIAYSARFESSDGWNVELAKEAKANALLAQLEQGALYAGTGVMPLVTSVVYDSQDYNDELWYVVSVSFTLSVYEEV